MSNGETPFSLTYGSKAVILAEIGMPTYRTMMIREGLNEEEIRLNLDLLTERRELAAIWEAKYKIKLEQYYNKKTMEDKEVPHTWHAINLWKCYLKGKFSKDVDTRKHRLLPDGLLPLKGPYDKISKGLAKRVQPECMAPKGKN
ncbi:hypothetical protein Tco_0491043 [Tanacetum coccineum]